MAASYYWIKLYHEILDDPKMATLPDRLWRRVIEIFLCAGRVDKNGELPPTNQIAWMLRMQADDVEADLEKIAATGIISRHGDGWMVNRFADRQSAVSDAERQRQSRDRKKKHEYYGDVTPPSRDVTQIISDIDTDKDIYDDDGEAPKRPNIFAIYEENITQLTPIVSDELIELEKDYPAGWVEDAIVEAANHNARNLAYIKAILRNRKDGKQKPAGKPINGNGTKLTPAQQKYQDTLAWLDKVDSGEVKL